jgi:hypothetical protein
MKNIFTAHPHSIGETYFQHMKFAFLFGAKMAVGGCASIIHAIFPFVFQTTGSNMLMKLAQFYIERKTDHKENVKGLSQFIEKKQAANKKVIFSPYQD